MNTEMGMSNEERYAPIDGYPQYIEGTNYGFFGWPTCVLDIAVRKDDAATLKEMIRRGWASKETRMLDGQLLRDWCAKHGHNKCAKALS